ncbi:MAG: universal stress protein [Anaeromyxobacteraceae bacterium]
MALEWKKILCPVDFSDASRAALRVASELARRFDGEVTVFHAYPLPGYTLPEGTVLPASGMLQELAEQTDALLARWKAEAVADGAPRVATGKSIGEPAAEIVAEAEDGKYDAIVVGTHGRTGLAHVLLGSVAERVVRRAPMPVVTVRPSPAAGK